MSKTALIFLHGSGGSGIELRTYLESFRIEAFNYKTFRQITDENNIDIYCPTSKSIDYLPAFGHPMNVWFNRSINFTNLGLNDTYEDTVEIHESINRIKKLIDDIYDKYDYIVLGGFSMGGGLSLYFTRETLPDKIIGIFSISSFLVESSIVFKSLPPPELVSKTPILMMHGTSDSLIPITWGRATGSNLLLAGFDVQFRKYEGVDHELCEEELSELFFWIQDLLLIRQIPQPAGSTSSQTNNNNLQNISSSNISPDTSVFNVTSSASSHLRYKIKPLDGYDKYVISYEAPSHLIDMICSRQVLTRGSYFDIERDDNKGVKTVVSSSDPDALAIEIGKRLLNRVQSDGGNFNPCPMS